MVKNSSSQRGALLMEALLAASIVAIAAIGTLLFTTRSLRVLRHVSHMRKPACERLSCAHGSATSTCACGTHSYPVIH